MGSPKSRRFRGRHRRFVPLVALLLCSLWLSSLSPRTLAGSAPAASAAIEKMPGELIALRASGEEVTTYVAPPVELAGPGIAAVQFDVTYSGFTQEAQAAFQYAVNIWVSQLTSPVTIRVQANWASLAAGVLGQAGADYRVRDFPGAPNDTTWYPAALANKLAGYDLYPNEGDISATFSSNYSNWYFGTGTTPPGKINFVSVVLHELGHGLGFSGSMAVFTGLGYWGNNSGYPNTYDRFVVDGAGNALLNTTLYPNPSAALASVLQGGALRFAGPAATAAAGGTAPRLYAPNPWQSGSSYAHLDEATFPAGNVNALMTPSIANGETVYAPGPIALGVLADIGWGTTPPPGSGPLLTLLGGNIQRAPAGESVSPSVARYGTGTEVTLTSQPPGGQTFVGWLVDGTYRGWANPLKLTMGGDHIVQATFAATVTFPDVGNGRADYAAIVALASRGTIRGYADGRFGPDDGVQRAQMAALIARATPLGPDTPPTTLTPPACLVGGTWDCENWGNGFQDRGGLDANLWRNVGVLQRYGVAFGFDGAACAARGVAPPCYGPTEAVSYAQTITFITRMMQAKGYWVAQPGAAAPYADVPGPHAADVATFSFYTNGIPAPPSNWNAGATRGWFARALWIALNSYWGTDAPGNGGDVP